MDQDATVHAMVGGDEVSGLSVPNLNFRGSFGNCRLDELYAGGASRAGDQVSLAEAVFCPSQSLRFCIGC